MSARWCGLAARAYPASRRDEVRATLLDARDAGALRTVDLLDVVGHGLAYRLRRWPRGESARQWADAAAVACVGLVTFFGAAAVGLVLRFVLTTMRWDVPHYGPRVRTGVFFVCGAGLATLVAVWTGRRRAARWLAGAVAVAAVVVGALAYGSGTWRPPSPGYVAILGVGGAGALVAILATDVVRRSATVVRGPVWGVVGIVTGAIAVGIVVSGGNRLPGTTEVLLVTYAVSAGVLLVLALPFWGVAPRLFAGAALVAAPAGPIAVLVVSGEYAVSGRAVPYAPVVAVVAAALPLLAGWAALRRLRRLGADRVEAGAGTVEP